MSLSGLTRPHFVTCPKLEPGFITPYVMCFLCSIENWLFSLLILVEFFPSK
jgi:hypothetical protein